MNEHPESNDESFDWDLHLDGDDQSSRTGGQDTTPENEPPPAAPAPSLYPDSDSDEPEFPFPDPLSPGAADAKAPTHLPPPPSADPGPETADTPGPSAPKDEPELNIDPDPAAPQADPPSSSPPATAKDIPDADAGADPAAPLLPEGDEPPLHPNRKRPGPRRPWLKRVLIGVPVVLLVLLLSLAAAVYFAGDWVFERAWPAIDGKLSKQGIYLAYEDIEKNRERGFVLKNIVLYRDENRSVPLATLADVAARVTWGKPDTGGGMGALITFDNSSLALDTGVTKPTLGAIGGAIAVGGGGLVIEQLHAEFQGLAFDIAGHLVWPEPPADAPDTEQEPPDPEDKTEDPATAKDDGAAKAIDLNQIDLTPVDQLVDWVRFDGPGAPVTVTVRFAQEKGEPLGVDTTVNAADFNWRSAPIKGIDLIAAAEIGEGTKTVSVPTLKLAYGNGALSGRLAADLTKQVLQIEDLKSTIDLAGLAAAAHPPTGEKLKVMRYAAPPSLAARGTVSLADPIASDLAAGIDFAQGLIVNLPDMNPLNITRLIGTFRLANSTVVTDNLHVGIFGGDLAVKANAGLAAKPIAFSTSIAATDIALSAIGSLFGEPSEPGDVIALQCHAAGTPEKVSISSLQLNHGNKKLLAQADVDTAARILELKSLQSNLDLIPLIAAAHPPTAESLAIVTSSSGPELAVQGSVNYGDLPLSRVAANIRSPEGFVLDLNGQPLALTNFATQVTLEGGTANARNVSVDTLGGAVRANLVAKPFDKTLPFAANLLVDSVQLASIATVAGSDKTEMPGAATLTFQGGGAPTLEGLRGNGTVKVDDAEFNIIPILGPLFQHLNTLGAAFRKGDPSLLEGAYTINQGMLATEDLTATVSGLEVVAPGTLDLVQKQIDIDFNVKGTGITGKALNLAGGKILRVTATGPLDNIQYDFGGGVAGTAIGVVSKATDLVTGKPDADSGAAAAPPPPPTDAQTAPQTDAQPSTPAPTPPPAGASPVPGAGQPVDPGAAAGGAPPPPEVEPEPKPEKKGFMQRLNPFKKKNGG